MPRFEPIAAAAILISLGSAAEAGARHRIDLPPGRLGDALVVLGRQAGVSIGVTDPALAAERVPAVRGTMTVEQALRRLLAGRAAAWVAIDPHTIRIERRLRATPPPAGRPPTRPVRPPTSPPAPPAGSEPRREAPIVEIVVTATKRPVLAAGFPGSVDILQNAELGSELGLRGSEALTARLPSLTSTHFGPGRNKLFIRGIADSSFNGPTQATVGQYFGEKRLTFNAPDPDLRLYDIERVEVLAGPQGTLYGAGSLGGIIRIVPNSPDPAEEGHLAIGVSHTWHGGPSADAAGMLNLPLAEGRSALRLVGWSTTEGGYIDDQHRGLSDVNRTWIQGGRAALRTEVAGAWTVDLGFTGQSIRGEDAQFALRDAPPLTRRSAVKQNFDNDYALAGVVLSREWNDLRLVNAVGAVRHRLTERFDATRGEMPPTLLEQTTNVSLLSLESRLSHGQGGDQGWLVGASLIRNDAVQTRAVERPGALISPSRVENDMTEAALFGEATVRLTPGLHATVGGRLVHSRLLSASPDPEFVFPGGPLPPTEGRRSEFRVLPSAALMARTGRDLTLFLRYQEGFRTGGLAFFGTEVYRFRSDEVGAVEGGVRYGLPGIGRFDAALAFAYTNWRNVQADIIDPGGRATTVNVGDGRIYTVDLRLGWRPLAGLELEAGAVWNDSLVFNEGPTIIVDPHSPLPNVADLNARAAIRYRTVLAGLGLSLSAAVRYVGRSRLGFGGILDEPQGEWSDVSLGGRAETGRHAFTLGITNLLGTVGNRFALGSPYLIGGERQITPLRPRTVRLGWELRF